METTEISTSESPPSQEQDRISLWIPFLLILCLFILLTVFIVCGHEIRRACRKTVDNQSDISSSQANVEVMVGLPAGEGTGAPDTPPPAYHNFQRQRSISYISDNSSQNEVPPDYGESILIYCLPSDFKPLPELPAASLASNAPVVLPNRLRRFPLMLVAQQSLRQEPQSMPSSPVTKHTSTWRSSSNRY